MSSKSIKFAFAVNQLNAFEPQNFGNADKFLIYEWINNDFRFLKEEANHFKNLDEDPVNGSERKGKAIIAFLNSLEINVLVSIKFGKNIQMVNSNFIPVIVSSETPEEVKLAVKKHIKWIEDELRNRPEEFKLFTIKNGILKTPIKNNTYLLVGQTDDIKSRSQSPSGMN
jgi:predicted Fe-Mo cluster-binding NifX family protein